MTLSIESPITSSALERLLMGSNILRKAGWIALFSQTGSEIVGVSNALGYQPSLVLTNNMDEDKWHPDMQSYNVVKFKHDDIMAFIRYDIEPSWIITLHGYLRILPESICNEFNIFNGHPGDIVTYPILKGKDPQQKALDLKLPSTGTIIHRVIPEVDAGQILRIQTCSIEEGETLDSLCTKLKFMSIQLWTDFIKTRLLLNENWN